MHKHRPISILTDMSVRSITSWIRTNNIHQTLEVVETIISRPLVYGELYSDIIHDIRLEIDVMRTVLRGVDSKNKYYAACWFLKDWRTGSLRPEYTDLSASLHRIEKKVNLLAMLNMFLR